MTLPEIAAEAPPLIIVCRGPPRCTGPQGDDLDCAWCYRFDADDPRSLDEIIAAVEGNDA